MRACPRGLGPILFIFALGGACSGENGTDSGDDSVADDGPDQCDPPNEAELAERDESSCTAGPRDYQPTTNADGDPYPACATDDGNYHLVEASPSSIARVQAFEEIMALLGPDATPEDFTMARTIYAMDEGLESRLQRREDLHYDPIPMADWMDGVDPDKQCTVESNVAKYPDRCVGPAKIGPLINELFAAGQSGDGEPAVLSAQIEAAMIWFMHLSVYKEANTCVATPKDCDSSWAYYGGGGMRADGIGLAQDIQGLSELAHQRIFDGITAVRCWRELYPIEQYPTMDDLPAEGQALVDDAMAQLDAALWYGYAQIVRDRIVEQDAVCGVAADANWAYVQIAGPVLDAEAARRDPQAASTLAALWANDAPTAADIEAGVAALDSAFSCP